MVVEQCRFTMINRFLLYVFDFYEAVKIHLHVCKENLIKNRLQISLLILSDFKRIN